MMLEELGSNDPESEKFFTEYMKEFILVMTLELREDGSFTLTPDMSRAQEHMVDAFLRYLRDSLEAQGITLPDEQIEQSAQAAASQMTSDLDPFEGSYKDENGMLTLGDNAPVPYVLTGDTLEFSIEEFGDLHFVRVG